MKSINSLQNPLVVYLKSLHQSKYRFEHKEFLVEGPHLVEEALKNGFVKMVLVTEKALSKFIFLQQFQEVYLVNDLIIQKLSQTKTPQPIMALCKMSQSKANLDASNNLLIFDNIQDPSNLGAIIRSSLAFDIRNIYLSNDSVDLYNHKVISASQGAIFQVNVVSQSLDILIPTLKRLNFFIFGTFLHESESPTLLHQVDWKEHNAIIFGNEGKGINQTYRSLIDENIVIHTSGKVESLNLATSAAIVSYCLFTINKLK